MSKLPQGWIEIELNEVTAQTDYPIGDGDHGQIKPSMYKEKGVPYIRVSDIGWGNFKPENLVYIDKETHKNNLKSELFPGDVLIAKTGATIGKCCIVPGSVETANTTSSVGKVTLDQRLMHPKYLLNYFLSREFKDFMWSISERTAQPGFNIRDMVKFKIPLPPKAEHDRIVAKLDSVMQKVESNKQRLEKIPKLLKRFRQSVLASAFSGNLTEDWRVMNRVTEKWEKTKITKLFKVKTGITPLRSNLSFYKGGTIPWVKTGEIKNRDIFEVEEKITKKALDETGIKIHPVNSILIAMYGEGKTRGSVGRLKIPAATNQACAVLINEEMNFITNQFVLLFLLSQYEEMRTIAVGGVRPNLNLDKVKSISLNLPSLEEQMEIVHRIEQLFVFIDKIEARYAKTKAVLEILPQSILAKAFRGELVPQNPNDEPASVLLERIKKEKEKLNGEKKKTKKEKVTA